jgi:hypothetical protein
MITSLFKGLWTALKNPKLVLLLWTWNLLLALAAFMPARAWLSGVLNTATETESLLTRFSFGAFADALKYNNVNPLSLVIASLVGLGFVALAGNAFMNGGLVESIGSPSDNRPFMHRFFRGGGHFFWRFFRLALVAGVTGAITVGIVATAVGAITSPLGDSEWEPAGLFWGLVTLAITGLVALLFVLALDYARIRAVRDGSRGMLRVFVQSLAFVLRHTIATYGIALVYLVLVGIVLLAYVAHEASWTTATWAAILVLIGVQQVLMLARSGLRVMQVGAEWAYFAATVPPAVVAPAPAPPIASVTPPAPVTTETTPSATPDAG